MGVCLRHVEAIDFSSLNSSLYVVTKGGRWNNLPRYGFPYSWRTRWRKLQLCTALRL